MRGVRRIFVVAALVVTGCAVVSGAFTCGYAFGYGQAMRDCTVQHRDFSRQPWESASPR